MVGNDSLFMGGVIHGEDFNGVTNGMNRTNRRHLNKRAVVEKAAFDIHMNVVHINVQGNVP